MDLLHRKAQSYKFSNKTDLFCAWRDFNKTFCVISKDSSENISEETEHNNNSETNDSCKDDLSENISEDMEHNNTSEKNDRCKDYPSEENSEEMECNDNSEPNDSNRGDLSENISWQESQSSRKLVVTVSRNTSGR